VTLALPYGLTADLLEDAEGPAYVEPTLPAGVARDRRRRWGYNGHLWETCRCADCAGRREGTREAGYGNPGR
jgi:hypothetical protein